MAWQDELLPGSFRGVGFSVSSTDGSTGRRSVKHEFPKKNTTAFTEDMGLRSGAHTLECFVIGPDYMRARDALLRALLVEGPGELVHPFLGTLRVQVGNVRFHHSNDAGGMCTFSVEYDETTAEPTQPATVVDGAAKLTVSANVLQVAAADEFLSKFDELATIRDSVLTAIGGVTSKVASVLGKVAIPGQVLAELTAAVTSITATTSTLIGAPSALADSLAGIVNGLGGALLGLPNAVATALSLYGADLGVRPPDDTPSRLAEQTNFDAVGNLWKRLVLAQASLLAVGQIFTTYDDAVRARLEITDLMDAHCDETADDTYPAIQDVRRDLVQAVPGDSVNLPRLVSYTPHATVPSLVLAHNLYGNLDREQDLIDRNRISNPGFIAGGRALEVLTRE